MREFYVFKIGKREDTSKPRIGNDGVGPGVAPARPRTLEERRAAEREQLRRAQRAVQNAGGFGLDEAVPAGDDMEAPQEQPGYGFHIHREDKKDMEVVFTTEDAAETYAKEQAALHPKQLYGVFSCEKVFETTAPSVIEKKYNNAGELLVVSK